MQGFVIGLNVIGTSLVIIIPALSRSEYESKLLLSPRLKERPDIWAFHPTAHESQAMMIKRSKIQKDMKITLNSLTNESL